MIPEEWHIGSGIGGDRGEACVPTLLCMGSNACLHNILERYCVTPIITTSSQYKISTIHVDIVFRGIRTRETLEDDVSLNLR